MATRLKDREFAEVVGAAAKRRMIAQLVVAVRESARRIRWFGFRP